MHASTPAIAFLAFAYLSATAAATRSPMPQDPPAATSNDPYLWLEDVEGDKALAWVRERNAESTKVLATGERFESLQRRMLSILDSTARIAYVAKRGDYYYNLWQDAQNPRGLWRRTTLEQYKKDAPQWDVVLDLDELGRQEHENWVWKGSTWLLPARDRCMLSLSRGGADASVFREFDLVTRKFVDGGFALPEAKSQVAWRDRDTLYVGTDFGAGSMTNSGYPRLAKLWRRGTPLSSATVVAEGKADDVAVTAHRDQTPGFERDLVSRQKTFYQNELFLLRDGKPVPIEKPDSADANFYHEWLLLQLREPWTVGGNTYPAGSLLATKLDGFLVGDRTFDVLFEPTERSSLADFSTTKNHLLLNVLDNVHSRITVLTPTNQGWQRAPLPGLPEFGTVAVSAVDDEAGDDYFLTITDYVTPTSLSLGTIGGGEAQRLKSLPAFFDAGDLAVEQREARSQDGTAVPYFLVMKKSAKRDGHNPTLLYGYGGFEVSLTPNYSPAVGVCWLEGGGVFAVANIRGGGEFGPQWHQAAIKQNRIKCYQDFAAVARDLVAQKITTSKHLGILGESNGGLLMGNMLTMYPELFSAIVCQVPLLDMKRYTKLLAGASWMGEYGDPDNPDEWQWLQRYSPYHNLHAETHYPKVLFTTSTRDDRVHPGHARKMMARMMEQGHDALYYENIEGGHGGSADNKQAAFMIALAYTFLWQQLQ